GRDEGHRVRSHGQPSDGGRLRGKDRQHGICHQHHALGPAHRLLRVDEPIALAARLEGEVPPAHRVRKQVVPQDLVLCRAHANRTPSPPASTEPTTLAPHVPPVSASRAASSDPAASTRTIPRPRLNTRSISSPSIPPSRW